MGGYKEISLKMMMIMIMIMGMGIICTIQNMLLVCKVIHHPAVMSVPYSVPCIPVIY